MSFWETIQGHHLADVLIHNLPKIADREQYSIRVSEVEKFDVIEKEIRNGSKFMTEVKDRSNHSLSNVVLLIFEK